MGFLNRDTPIVVIDDDAKGRERLAELLGPGGGGCSKVMTFADPADALASLPVDVTVAVICEQNLPGASGVEWIPDMLRAVSGPVILMSSNADVGVATQAFRRGAYDFLDKTAILAVPGLLYEAIREGLRRYTRESRHVAQTRHLKLTTGELGRRNERLNQHIADTHRFVENVAHEFRTPLTVIQEYAALSQEWADKAQDVDAPASYLEHIISTTRDLAELVDDLLDSSRVRTRSLRVDRRVYPVAHLFESARPLLLPRARAKGIEISEKIEGACEVFCDLQKAKRIIINLVINAIKFSPESATVHLRAEPCDGHDVKISVVDEGPGLSAEAVNQLGERFRQFEQHPDTESKGYGLGLNIAKELVRLNLGRMAINSDPGQGSTFSFTLPGADPEHAIRRVVELLRGEFEPLDISLLHAVSSNGPSDTPRLRAFLAAHCHPMDLILDTMNDEGLMLIGITAEPDQWIKRLHEAHMAISGAGGAPDAGQLHLSWLGTWSGNALPDALANAAMDRIVGRRACA